MPLQCFVPSRLTSSRGSCPRGSGSRFSSECDRAVNGVYRKLAGIVAAEQAVYFQAAGDRSLRGNAMGEGAPILSNLPHSCRGNAMGVCALIRSFLLHSLRGGATCECVARTTAGGASGRSGTVRWPCSAMRTTWSSVESISKRSWEPSMQGWRAELPQIAEPWHRSLHYCTSILPFHLRRETGPLHRGGGARCGPKRCLIWGLATCEPQRNSFNIEHEEAAAFACVGRAGAGACMC